MKNINLNMNINLTLNVVNITLCNRDNEGGVIFRKNVM